MSRQSRQGPIGSKERRLNTACGCERNTSHHTLCHFQLPGMIEERPDSSSKAGTKQMKYLEQK